MVRTVIHCESCGVPNPDESIAYCIECDMYVCTQCWNRGSRRCTACTGSQRRRAESAARRADRRLREVLREAELLAMAAPVATDAFESRVLAIKARFAAEAGAAALGRLRASSSSRERLRARFSVDVEKADLAIGRLREAGLQRKVAQTPASTPVRRDDRWMWAAATVVSAGLLAAVTVTALTGDLGRDAPREEVLGGAAPLPTDRTSPAPSVAPTIHPPQGGGAATDIAIQFDDVRMSSGLGPGWFVEPANPGVGVAALPNAVNRSARLEAGASPTRACRTLAEGLTVTAVLYDILVDARLPTAELTLTGDAGDMTVAMSSAGGHISLSADAGVDLPSIEAGSWYRVSVDLEMAELQIRERGSSGSGRVTDVPAPVAPAPYERVCLRIEGEPGAAAYFDNITVSTEEG